MLIPSDNVSTVAAMCSGRAQDPILRGVLREAWLISALNDVDIMVRHLPGVRMGIADQLSRETVQAGAAEFVRVFKKEPGEVEMEVPRFLLGPPIAL